MKWMPFYYELFCPVAIFLERLAAATLASSRDPNRLAFSHLGGAHAMWRRGLGIIKPSAGETIACLFRRR